MKRSLTDTTIRNAKPQQDEKSKKYADGGGLYLLVTKQGKYWRYDYRFEDKRKTLAIGVYPALSLKEARARHEEARSLLAHGVDPLQHKKQLQKENDDIASNSFEVIARAWFERCKPNWSESHINRTLRYLERDVFPWLGKLNISKVTPSDIIRVVQRVEDRGAGDAARRVKQYIVQIYRYAVTMELADRNPAADIDNNIILKPRIKRHFAAITDPLQTGQLLRDMASYQGSFIVRCALMLSPLVMLRPANVRAAEWSEINLDSGLWCIPIAKMKVRTHIKQANLTQHVVPLSRQAVAILREIQPLTGHFKYVFPSARGASKPLSDNGIRTALRTMGYDNDTMTPHGFRSMASTMLNRALDRGGHRLWDKDLIEQQLAHVDGTVRGDYNRADSQDAIQQRRVMLQYWADYLDQLQAGAHIIPIRTDALSLP